MDINFGKTASDYGTHRAGFPDALYDWLAGFALRGCTVTGLDPSDNLIAEARRLDGVAGVQINYVTATAEDTGLPGLPSTWSPRASAGTGSTGPGRRPRRGGC
ncbi:MAG: class I SAM-dependent methyltransferase [Alphaproteobacteria bacterium]